MTMPSTRRRFDAVVLGAGPAGAAAAHWLARAGWEVGLVERAAPGRDKPCGDALTPRAVRQLEDMGLHRQVNGFHTIAGLRLVAHGREFEHPWRAHPLLGSVGKVARRAQLDAMVMQAAAEAGATVWPRTEALETRAVPGGGPAGRIESVELRATGAGGVSGTVTAPVFVIATGASSRFAASLGIRRHAGYALGLAFRRYCASERHDDPYIEIDMELRDTTGASVAGYGWAFPVGDGQVNLGVGILTTYRGWRALKADPLFRAYYARNETRWGLRPYEPGRLHGGRLPLGASMAPISGGNYVVIGDAGGLNNPFIGEGIGYAYETGRLAAAVVDEALDSGDPGALADFETEFRRRHGRHLRLGNAFARLIGRPRAMEAVTRLGMAASGPVLNTVLPIMDNSLGAQRFGAPEIVYRLARCVAAPIPDRWIVPPAGRQDHPRSRRPRTAPSPQDRLHPLHEARGRRETMDPAARVPAR